MDHTFSGQSICTGGGHDGSYGVLVQSTGGHDMPITADWHGGVDGHDGSLGLAWQSTLQDASLFFAVVFTYG